MERCICVERGNGTLGQKRLRPTDTTSWHRWSGVICMERGKWYVRSETIKTTTTDTTSGHRWSGVICVERGKWSETIETTTTDTTSGHRWSGVICEERGAAAGRGGRRGVTQ
ncbi:hypothetical protein J6590_073702 [Homalodisca vitripennis]|nr:hypothetical protein J6590_073702 [Homalodisca vitripennis]